jgi:hypothetical protein
MLTDRQSKNDYWAPEHVSEKKFIRSRYYNYDCRDIQMRPVQMNIVKPAQVKEPELIGDALRCLFSSLKKMTDGVCRCLVTSYLGF